MFTPEGVCFEGDFLIIELARVENKEIKEYMFPDVVSFLELLHFNKQTKTHIIVFPSAISTIRKSKQ